MKVGSSSGGVGDRENFYSSSSNSTIPATSDMEEWHICSKEEQEEEEAIEEAEVTQNDQQGSASTSTIKKRGPSRLPKSSMPLMKRPIVQPVGDRTWYVVGRGNHTRQVNSIIGVLLKKHFPGLITLHGKEEPGFTWAHYQAAPDKNFGNKAERIKAEIWCYYTCLEGLEEQAGLAVEKSAKHILPDMKHRVRVQAVIDFHGLDEYGKKMKKAVACNKYLRREEYLSVVPKWCEDHPACWEKMVDTWCNPAWHATHDQKRTHRLMMGGTSHTQGSLNITGVQQKMEQARDGAQVHVFEAFVHGHRGKEPGQAYCSRQAKERAEAYTASFQEIHGSEAYPIQHPLDPEAVMKAGEGKKNGRYYLGDGAIPTSSTPTLSQIRVHSTNSSSSIRSRPSPTTAKIAELQAQMEARERALEERFAAERALWQEQQEARDRAMLERLTAAGTICSFR